MGQRSGTKEWDKKMGRDKTQKGVVPQVSPVIENKRDKSEASSALK